MRGFFMLMSAALQENTKIGIQASGFQVLRDPDRILLPASASLWSGGFARGSAPARRKGSLTLGRAGLPSLPRGYVLAHCRQTSIRLCRPGDPPPARPPLHLATPVSPTGRVAAQRCASTQAH